MARNVFLSFLGTNRYQPCQYSLNDIPLLTTRFVQKAIISFNCREWTNNDRIFIFTTGEAFKTNWECSNLNDFVLPESSEPCLKESLASLLFKPKAEAVMIPEEVSEKTIWSIFKIIYDRIETGDNLVIDITHGFRSSPMLLLTLANYCSFLKESHVIKIYYGAYDAMKTLKKDYAPIWELTDFILMQEWTTGANDFMSYGNPNKISGLAKKSALPQVNDVTNKESARKVTKFAGAICEATDLFTAVRGESIFLSKIIKKIVETSEEVEEINFVAPLQPFMAKIREKFSGFHESDVINFIPSVKYCIDHGLIQQGFTFLQEGIVSYALSRSGIKWRTRIELEKKNVTLNRSIVSGVMNYLEVKTRGSAEGWQWPDQYPDELVQMLLRDRFCMKISGVYVNISEYRNDINHAGYICPKEPQKFVEALTKYYNRTVDIIKATKTTA